MESTIPNYEIALDFTNYIRSIRDIHQVCLAKEVDLAKSKAVLEDDSSRFYHLFMEHNLNMTLKVHIILHHYQYYFEKYGTTMRHTNGEFTESCHSTLRKSEETHGVKVKRKVGTPMHAQRSITIFNSKRAGFTIPLRLKKKITLSPSPVNHSPFIKKFFQKYPDILGIHNLMYCKKQII